MTFPWFKEVVGRNDLLKSATAEANKQLKDGFAHKDEPNFFGTKPLKMRREPVPTKTASTSKIERHGPRIRQTSRHRENDLTVCPRRVPHGTESSGSRTRKHSRRLRRNATPKASASVRKRRRVVQRRSSVHEANNDDDNGEANEANDDGEESDE